MKKIDVNKSLIFSRNVEDLQNSLQYLYLSGYFSNCKDFSEYEEGTLDIVHVAKFSSTFYAFIRDGDRHDFIYFIPKSEVVFVEEEKKLRPYKNISEFCNATGCKRIGVDIITLRNKNNKIVSTLMYSGFCKNVVHLGGYVILFGDLFRNYEFLYKGDWLPFGVEE